MDIKFLAFFLFALNSCTSNQYLKFLTIDTDFSKGRLIHKQRISIKDIEKFHGHLCDGLVLGTLALQQALKVLYPNQPIDRTNLRIVSKPSPCLTDVAIYLTGGRYQFNTFYVDTSFNGIYIVQRIDNLKTVSVYLKNGIKPAIIDSLGKLAINQKLNPCEINYLKKLENNFAKQLYQSNPKNLFVVIPQNNFVWNPNPKNDYLKTDILNKNQPKCKFKKKKNTDL